MKKLACLLIPLLMLPLGCKKKRGNQAPVLAAIAAVVLGEDQVKETALSATDPDKGQTLRFCLHGESNQLPPAWATVSGEGVGPGPVTGLLKLQPGANDTGIYGFKVRVYDEGSCANPGSTYGEQSVQVTVQVTNSAPVLNPIGALSVNTGSVLEVAVKAQDPDTGQILAFCKASGPAWATLTGGGATPSAMAALRLSPSRGDEGAHTVKVRVYDTGTCSETGGAFPAGALPFPSSSPRFRGFSTSPPMTAPRAGSCGAPTGPRPAPTGSRTSTRAATAPSPAI